MKITHFKNREIQEMIVIFAKFDFYVYGRRLFRDERLVTALSYSRKKIHQYYEQVVDYELQARLQPPLQPPGLKVNLIDEKK